MAKPDRGSSPDAAELNKDVVKVTECKAWFCFDMRASVMWGTADYTLKWMSSTQRYVSFDAEGLDVRSVLLLKGCSEETGAPLPPGCSHHRSGADKQGCCMAPRHIEKAKLSYKNTANSIIIKVPSQAESIRIKYMTTGHASMKWWSGLNFVHSTGEAINNRSLLPVIDSSSECVDWHITVCYPREFKAWVPTKSNKPPTPAKCSTCKRKTSHFFLPATSSISLAIVLAKNMCTVLLTRNPLPVYFHYQKDFTSEPIEPIVEALKKVVITILTGMAKVFPPPGHGFTSYTIIAIPNKWHLQGLALPSSCFLNSSVLVRCNESNVSAMQVLAHELSHEWFGYQVRSKNGSEAWLDEAFAVYYETRLLQVGRGIGKEDMWLQMMMVGRMREHLLEATFDSIAMEGGGKLQEGNDLVARHKGYLVLLYIMRHMQKAEKDLESFDAMVRGWCVTYRGKKVTTDDFLQFYGEYIKDGNGASLDTVTQLVKSADIPDEIRVVEIDDDALQKTLGEVKQCVQSMDTKTLASWEKGKPASREKWCVMLDMLREADGLMTVDDVMEIGVQLSKMGHDDLEVLCRFFELVIATKAERFYYGLFKFLCDNQCASAYLIAELLLLDEAHTRGFAQKVRLELAGHQTHTSSELLDEIFEVHEAKRRRKM